MLSAGAVPASAAEGESTIHFAHAVPGLGDAELLVNGKEIGRAGFGEVTESASVPAGRSQLTLLAPGDVTVRSTQAFEAGKAYTLVGMAGGEGAEVRSFEDDPARPGVARIRLIHAAPELGEPDMVLNGRTLVDSMQYTEATRYWTLKPGDYQLRAEDPATGKAVLSTGLTLTDGSTQTALVVGSSGEQADIVLAQNDVAAPAGAPATGLGGLLPNGPDWLAALVAALAAGGFGLAAWAGFARKRIGPLA